MNPTDWLPFYPDAAPRRRPPYGPALVSQPPYTTAIFPVTDVLASLTFAPVYANRAPARRAPHETMVWTTPLGPLPVSPLSWLPILSSALIRRPPRGCWVDSAPPPSTQVVIAQSLAWQARGTDQRPVARGLPTRLRRALTWTVDPTILTAPCVDLGLEAVATTDLLNEALASPALIDEALGTPTLLNEDLC